MTNFKEIQSSLIISVYKNTLFLDAVLKSMLAQTFRNFEVIIPEDGDSEEMRDFLSRVKMPFPLRHLTQEDMGWRKNPALNGAVPEANSDWLVFIDGNLCGIRDLWRFTRRWQIKNTSWRAGKRLKFDPKTSELLVSGKVKPEEMNSRILLNFSKINNQITSFVKMD